MVFIGYMRGLRYISEQKAQIDTSRVGYQTLNMPRGQNTYSELDLHDQILLRPDAYIGSVRPTDSSEMTLAPSGIRESVVTLADGARRVFLEILANAGDNVLDSIKAGVDPGIISTTFDDDGWITIRNGGLTIPVIPHKNATKDNLFFVPTNVFSRLLTSSNYDDTEVRMGCGRNGLGAKLTNIFSTRFEVEVGDPERGQIYRGSWENNMKIKTRDEATPGYEWKDGWTPVEGDLYRGLPFVQVRWRLDFSRFGTNSYTSQDIALLQRYVIDFSLSCHVPVMINGSVRDVRSIRKYASLFWPEDICNKGLVFHIFGERPEEYKEGKSGEMMVARPNSLNQIPMMEIIVVDGPEDGRIISFVNGLMTNQGGIHVEAILEKLSPAILSLVNKGDDSPKLTLADLRCQLSMVINCRLPNPEYTSQSKTKLSHPKPIIRFDFESLAKRIRGWGLIDRLKSRLEAKIRRILFKPDGRRRETNIICTKGEDANRAGTKDSKLCTLYIVEGLSASSYPKKRIEYSDGGKDLFGYYPIQGKFINATAASVEHLAGYPELKAIRKMLGLDRGLPEEYEDQDFRASKLRYGSVVIMTDADTDGTHILCLLLNYFYKEWPSLLRDGLIKYLLTPMIRVVEGKKCKARFYDTNSFSLWRKSNPEGKAKYYKGLGTSEDHEIKEDLVTAAVVSCQYDDQSPHLLDMLFDPSRADDRKRWIERRRGNVVSFLPPPGDSVSRTISSVLDNDFVPYTLDSLFRALASYRDGWKRSQRQALTFLLHHWNYGRSEREPIRVNVLGGDAGRFTKYHHGDKSMVETIIHMTQSFTGSNNLSVIDGKGQFGTRDDGGQDAADGRYVYAKLASWTHLIFQKDMVELVPKREVEGETAEPIWIPCDIPMGIINGMRGVATGWSTNIPSHHPVEIIDWILARLDDKITPPLIPWFAGFTGTTIIRRKSDKSNEALPGEDPSRCSGRSLVTYGRYEEKDGKIIVSELPIGRWMSTYRTWIQREISEKKIKGMTDKSTTSTPLFHIESMTDKPSNLSLKLKRSYGMNNLVLIDDEGYPLTFSTVEQMMVSYFTSMELMYKEVKVFRLRNMNENIGELKERLEAIRIIIEDKDSFFRVSEDKLQVNLSLHNIKPSLFDKLKVRDCTQSQIDSLERSIRTLIDEESSLKATAHRDLWRQRLNALRPFLLKRFPLRRHDAMEVEVVDGVATAVMYGNITPDDYKGEVEV